MFSGCCLILDTILELGLSCPLLLTIFLLAKAIYNDKLN